MSTLLARVRPVVLPVLDRGPELPEVVRAWLAGRSIHTVRAYETALAAFSAFLGGLDPLPGFLQGDAAGAYHAALAWRGAMLDAGLSTSTISQRLAALRSLVKLARQVGFCTWTLEVEGPRVEPRRDLRGPTRPEWEQVWAVACRSGDDLLARRNRAVLAVSYLMALRRSEVAALDLADLDLAQGTLLVRGKGRREKAPLPVPVPLRGVLLAWLAVRGPAPGPLFLRVDHAAGPLDRLGDQAIADLVADAGKAAGLPGPLRPHGLRHSAITTALDTFTVRQVAAFARHRSVTTTMRYDDLRNTPSAAIAETLARSVRSEAS